MDELVLEFWATIVIIPTIIPTIIVSPTIGIITIRYWYYLYQPFTSCPVATSGPQSPGAPLSGGRAPRLAALRGDPVALRLAGRGPRRAPCQGAARGRTGECHRKDTEMLGKGGKTLGKQRENHGIFSSSFDLIFWTQLEVVG